MRQRWRRGVAGAAVWVVLGAACAQASPDLAEADRALALMDRADLACQDREELGFGLLCYGDGPTLIGVFDDAEDLARVLRQVAEGNLRNERPIIAGQDDSEFFLIVVPDSVRAEQVRRRVGGDILVTPEEIRQYASSATGG